jgi:TPR repeat protein
VRRISFSGYNTELILPHFKRIYDMTTEAADIVDFNSAMSAFESKHFSTAIQLLSPFAEKGNPDAQHRCAIMFQNGLGVAVNEAKALEYMTAAAEQGHGVAQHGLGFMYMEGECVEKDAEKALEWFLKAAEQGLVGSMTTIAMMYEEGKGVEKNPELAKEWYTKAGF